ncbi:MAG: hypothetical protein AB7U73_05515 [Pirellulales bacterium]
MNFLTRVDEGNLLRATIIGITAASPGLIGFLVWRTSIGATPLGLVGQLATALIALPALLTAIFLVFDALSQARNRLVRFAVAATFLIQAVGLICSAYGCDVHVILLLAVGLELSLGTMAYGLTMSAI